MENTTRRYNPDIQKGTVETRLNAVRHGVLSESPVVPLAERQEDWLEHRENIFRDLQPEGALQDNLVERVAVLFWRLRRVVRYEREAIHGAQVTVPSDWRMTEYIFTKGETTKSQEQIMDEMDRMFASRLMPSADDVKKITRYEVSYHRMLLQTLHHLALAKGFTKTLPHSSKDGVPNLSAVATRVPALPTEPVGPSPN